MLAVEALSGSAQAVVYFIALVFFVVAAILALTPQPKNYWAALVAGGLAGFAFVNFWNALAVS